MRRDLSSGPHLSFATGGFDLIKISKEDKDKRKYCRLLLFLRLLRPEAAAVTAEA
jgi:hypothetical protein